MERLVRYDVIQPTNKQLNNWALRWKTWRQLGCLTPEQVALSRRLGFSFESSLHRWRPFKEARKLAQNLGLKTKLEWDAWTKSGKRPSDIPSNPYDVYYSKGWVSWGDWLGTGAIGTLVAKYRPYRAARAFVRSLGVKTQGEWSTYLRTGKRPSDIPAHPHEIYEDEWTSWGDFFGTNNRHWKGFLSFHKARKLVRSLGLQSVKEYQTYQRKYGDLKKIPFDPRQTYGKRFQGMADFLNARPHHSNMLPYAKAKPFARAAIKKFGLAPTMVNWHKLVSAGKLPHRVSAQPWVVYKGQYSFGDWSGNGRKHSTPQYWVTVARNLAKMNNGVVPGRSRLIKDGKGGLLMARWRHPQLFRGIKFKVGRKR